LIDEQAASGGTGKEEANYRMIVGGPGVNITRRYQE
jgi:hypothetical protein